MATCPKCGSRVRDGMNFCPNCGADLKVPTPSTPTTAEAPSTAAPSPAQPTHRPEKAEKQEKQEKEEREEKQEKGEREHRYEKRESNFMGPLIGGVVLILVGLLLYWVITASLRVEVCGALFFVIIGIVIVIGAIYAITTASRRHPKT